MLTVDRLLERLQSVSRFAFATMHLLKNGHPAHIFTDEDRRKAAAVTNQIRRERAHVVAMELEAELLARKAEMARERVRSLASVFVAIAMLAIIGVRPAPRIGADGGFAGPAGVKRPGTG